MGIVERSSCEGDLLDGSGNAHDNDYFYERRGFLSDQWEPPKPLRMGKGTKTGVGCKRDESAPRYQMKRYGPMRRIGKTKRGREQRIFDGYVRPVIVQETAEALGLSFESINECECDHIFGRNATGFEPIGAMFSPLNLQMISAVVHSHKTNSLTGEGQRKDFRDTETQERMTALTARIVAKLGNTHTLKDIRNAFKAERFSSKTA